MPETYFAEIPPQQCCSLSSKWQLTAQRNRPKIDEAPIRHRRLFFRPDKVRYLIVVFLVLVALTARCPSFAYPSSAAQQFTVRFFHCCFFICWTCALLASLLPTIRRPPWQGGSGKIPGKGKGPVWRITLFLLYVFLFIPPRCPPFSLPPAPMSRIWVYTAVRLRSRIVAGAPQQSTATEDSLDGTSCELFLIVVCFIHITLESRCLSSKQQCSCADNNVTTTASSTALNEWLNFVVVFFYLYDSHLAVYFQINQQAQCCHLPWYVGGRYESVGKGTGRYGRRVLLCCCVLFICVAWASWAPGREICGQVRPQTVTTGLGREMNDEYDHRISAARSWP